MRTFQILCGIALAGAAALGQNITTVAGSYTGSNTADGGPAISTKIPGVSGIVFDQAGNLYVWDSQSSKVKMVDTSGNLHTAAGNGVAGFGGDNGSALNAELEGSSNLNGLAVDAAGNLYISDSYNNVIRKVDKSGNITTFAGAYYSTASNLLGQFGGDHQPANQAQLSLPAGLAFDSAGNLYIADSGNNRVRKVDTSGIITTVAGNGHVVYEGDGVQAINTAVPSPQGVTVDGQGNLYIASTTLVRRVDTSGNITTYAGTPPKKSGYSGDNGPANAALLKSPSGLVVDNFGNLFIADADHVRKVDATGTITTYAGVSGNASTPIGDGGPATSAYLGVTQSVTLDSSGNLYIGTAQTGGHVRKVTASGSGFLPNPPSLSFSYTIGGSNPAAQNLAVTSSGAALTYTAGVSTSSGGNWLSVTPANGSTPANLTVSVNPSGLSGGVTYMGTITLTPGGSGNSPLAVQVSLAVAGAGAPSINAGGIRNASGYQNTLAPDTVFAIFGNNLGPAALVQGTGPNYLTNLDGTSVTFTPVAGGTPINAGMVYTVNTQVAGVLPSSITPGTYSVSVMYNGQASGSQNVTVLSRSFGIAAANGGGTGLAQATIGNVNSGLSLTRFTAGSVVFGGYNWILSPAHPGDAVVLWGTGGGADPANDTGGTSGDQTAAGNFTVAVDGVSVTPAYAGASSGYPGLWQINFTIPATMAPDCYATVQVSAGGALSNVVNIPVAAAGLTTCVDPNTPAAVFSKLDAGGNIVLAAFAAAKLSESNGVQAETASGSVQSRTPTEWLTLESGPVFGACRVYDRTFPTGGVDPGSPFAFLDAGAALHLTGPNLPAGVLGTVSTSSGPAYGGSLPTGTLAAGTYTLTGSGGTQVGPFNVSTAFPGSFSLTNPAITTISRSQPLTLGWSGSSFDHVQIILTSSVTGGGSQHITTMTCSVPSAPGSYTIPAAALSLLVPSSSGTLAVEGANLTTFSANLSAGGQIDLGDFSANLGVTETVPIQ